MKKLNLFFILLILLVPLTIVSCEKDKTVSIEEENQYVNNWIHKQMSIYYYWNDKLPSNSNYALKPDKFFDSLLNHYDKNRNPEGDRFSQIKESYIELLKMLGGISSDEIGFEYIPVNISPNNATTKRYILLVLYPKPGTDAFDKGVKRGRLVVKIDNKEITEKNFKNLIGGAGNKTLTLADWIYNSESKKHKLKVDDNPVTIRMHKDFAENPIYMDSVYAIKNHKIGYLVYNFFARDKGNNSYAYDKELMQTLEKFKSKGVNEFVLDLRYNSGGAVSSAIALASGLVENRSTDKLFASAEYNDLVHRELKKEYGDGYNKDYFIDKIVDVKYDKNGNEISRTPIAAIPSLNLPRLYVLVSRFTASASELIINGLKPYMDIVLIGEKTVGKNVGSISIYEKNDPKNKWGMQPIIVKYFNSAKKSDFTAGFAPNYALNEFENLQLLEFGNKEELFLNKALSVITGSSPVHSSSMRLTKGTGFNLGVMENSASIKTREIDDDIRQKAIRNVIGKFSNNPYCDG